MSERRTLAVRLLSALKMIATIMHKIARLDAHERLFIGLGVATISYFAVPVTFIDEARITSSWVGYALTVLLLMWVAIFVAHPRDIPKLSRLQDSSRSFILAFVVAAAVASLFAVIALLDSSDKQYTLLAILAVVSAWSLVHTVFTLHYAHLYYGNSTKQTNWPGGLDFPHEPEPDYLDFAYFSFVIGMTSQVSDVAIGSKTMRRVALTHGVLSFSFNTIIIALTISSLTR